MLKVILYSPKKISQKVYSKGFVSAYSKGLMYQGMTRADIYIYIKSPKYNIIIRFVKSMVSPFGESNSQVVNENAPAPGNIAFLTFVVVVVT